MKKMITESAYAKINLWLDILGKRDDGYHEIKTVMQTVSLCDTVTVERTDGETAMVCSDKTLSCGEDNLCIKAVRAFLRATGAEGSFFVKLEKNIPREAGLGGGSADAAAVLRAMNRLCGTELTEAELCGIGKTIGADVPFCVRGGACLAEGIGEILTGITPLADCHIVISGGIGHISTSAAYRAVDNVKRGSEGNFDGFVSAFESRNIESIGRFLYNRFEDAAPECASVKKILNGNGAKASLMTGSGSAVFGLFSDEKSAVSAASELKKSGLTAYLCRPVP